MALLTQAPKGTQDFLPIESAKFQYVEKLLRDTAELYGFYEIRTPVFEHTELFVRSVGDTTDVVQKEMYTFTDKGDRSITLKPEGTAGAVRAAIERGLLGGQLPVKVSYITPCFRYEKPQAGRYRQFHQFGLEMLGSDSPTADAEIIGMVNGALVHLGVDKIRLRLNSIGCPECRPKYHEALVAYLRQHEDGLCPTCKERMKTNPMRVIDCKVPGCAEIVTGAPKMLDFLCEACDRHFASVKNYLGAMDITFEIDPGIVRGLDYYTKTVFEFVTDAIGAQGTVCGGGRYDGLVEALGGGSVPGMGFAIGLERLILVMEASGAEFPPMRPCDIYIATLGDAARLHAAALVQKLRNEGFWAETDIMGRSMKAQMRYADKIGARYNVAIGDGELESGVVTLKNMRSGKTAMIPVDSEFVRYFYQQIMEEGIDEAVASGDFD